MAQPYPEVEPLEEIPPVLPVVEPELDEPPAVPPSKTAGQQQISPGAPQVMGGDGSTHQSGQAVSQAMSSPGGQSEPDELDPDVEAAAPPPVDELAGAEEPPEVAPPVEPAAPLLPPLGPVPGT